MHSGLPKKLIDELSEHSSCFTLFYFDSNGEPCFYENIPQTKDSMAMLQFVAEYLKNQSFTAISKEEDSDDDDNSFEN
jgi:hypothetical protein